MIKARMQSYIGYKPRIEKIGNMLICFFQIEAILDQRAKMTQKMAHYADVQTAQLHFVLMAQQAAAR